MNPSDSSGPKGAACPVVSFCGPFTRGRWSPYVAGAGIGLLSILVFALVDKPIGMSTQVAALSGSVAAPFIGGQAVAENTYWKVHAKPGWNYGMAFLTGTFLGALASALASGSFRVETVPAVWAARFGGGKWPRLLAAFAGGALMLYGARLADGCTSGHGISGGLQLAVSSWLFFIVIFASGVLTAAALFGLRDRARRSG